jgi:hypothetical protein
MKKAWRSHDNDKFLGRQRQEEETVEIKSSRVQRTELMLVWS